MKNDRCVFGANFMNKVIGNKNEKGWDFGGERGKSSTWTYRFGVLFTSV